ncbi:hypothetical protein [Capnocytophaga sp.]|uniref:hypothetical protein n=1 Tax=Capnocytophaga sp. TaxID=44737 RepID=UPI0026DDA365|nr:hypothetical protein [Capnocytophaga sp.]MDO5106207.1 hypothetical protein [Capnocytophaga sp.]
MYKKIDQFLLERYPSVWNTKIFWMFAVSLPVHLSFFAIGWASLSESDLIRLYYSPYTSDYFVTPFLLHLIISILLIVGWLVMLFKHNAFKNFYPSNPLKLFGQFVQYFVILSCCILFSISFLFGIKLKANIVYTDDYVSKLIEKYATEAENNPQTSYTDNHPTVFEMTDQQQDTLRTTSENENVALIEEPNDNLVTDEEIIDTYNPYHESKIYNLESNLEEIDEISTVTIILAHLPWIFSLCLLIFCFRVTNLRTLLFTIIFSGVLSLTLGIFSFIMAMGVGGDSVAWLYILTAYGIILASIGLVGKIPKLFSGILINFSLLFFVPATFGAFAQTTDFMIFENNFIEVSYFIFGLGFVFVFLYTHLLHKWRALPE